MKQLAIINPEKVPQNEILTYPLREAVRAVVVDKESNIALLHVKKDHYYKLPGGGIEDDEDHESALRRECLEEIGSEIEVINEIGLIIEYRKIFTLKQVSYCYLATLKGEKGIPNFTEKEKENGFEQIWIPYEQALEVLSKNIAIDLEGKEYIVPRDTILLKEAEAFLLSTR